MYKVNKVHRSKMTSVVTVEGETLEQKIERIVANKEPITDGAPEVFTERKEGVLSAYNIRTDRWEVAASAMDMVSGNIAAKRDGIGKVVQLEPKEKEVSGAETVDGGNQPSKVD
jgi:hypothetical protein